MRPVYRRRGEPRVLLGLLLMLGVAIIIDGFLVWRYPIEALSLRIGGDAIEILGVRMRTGSLLASAIALGRRVRCSPLFFRFATTGKAVRSVIQDEEGAQLCGVNPAAIRSLVFTLSGVLAALVAVTRSMTSPVTVNAGIDFTILALIVAVVGGLGSVSGAFLAGVLLGDRQHGRARTTSAPTSRPSSCSARPRSRSCCGPSGLLGVRRTDDRRRRRVDRRASLAARLRADRHDRRRARAAAAPLRRLPDDDGRDHHRPAVRRLHDRVQRHLRQHRPAVPLRRRPGRDSAATRRPSSATGSASRWS